MGKSDRPRGESEAEPIDRKESIGTAIDAWLSGEVDHSEIVQSDPEWRDIAIRQLQHNFRSLPSPQKTLLMKTLLPCLQEGSPLHNMMKHLIENQDQIGEDEKRMIEQAFRLRIALHSSVAEWREPEGDFYGHMTVKLVDIDGSLKDCGPLLLYLDSAKYQDALNGRFPGYDKWVGYRMKCEHASVSRAEIETWVGERLRELLPDRDEDGEG